MESVFRSTPTKRSGTSQPTWCTPGNHTNLKRNHSNGHQALPQTQRPIIIPQEMQKETHLVQAKHTAGSLNITQAHQQTPHVHITPKVLITHIIYKYKNIPEYGLTHSIPNTTVESIATHTTTTTYQPRHIHHTQEPTEECAKGHLTEDAVNGGQTELQDLLRASAVLTTEGQCVQIHGAHPHPEVAPAELACGHQIVAVMHELVIAHMSQAAVLAALTRAATLLVAANRLLGCQRIGNRIDA
jgi:hypothetical protein